MNITKDIVLQALSHVLDPDLKKDLVSLKMIDNIIINDTVVEFTVVLTTPACPLKEQIKNSCIEAIHQYINKDIDVKVNLSSKVTTKFDKSTVLPKVKNIIMVASGKGGVGKSTISANLAIALSKTGAKVGIVDADIYGPSIPLMFGLLNAKPQSEMVGEKQLILPIEQYGIKVLSIGFFVDPDKALIWRGPMAANALMQLFTETNWGELDYLVIDMPPGTGDIQLSLVQSLPITGAVVVSTPQEVALADARKGVNMFLNDNIKLNVIGLVENMAYFIPEDNKEKKYYIFGKDGCKKLSEQLNVPFLGQVPIEEGVCSSGDAGKPIVLNENTIVSKTFLEIAKNVAQQVSIINANSNSK